MFAILKSISTFARSKIFLNNEKNISTLEKEKNE